MKMKNLLLISLFTLLSMSIKAQTGDNLYEAMQNLEYDKAETISLNILKEKVKDNSSKELIDQSYAHYSLGLIYSLKSHNKFNIKESYFHLEQSKLIVEKVITIDDSKDNRKFANSLIKQANSNLNFLIKNYPELAKNVLLGNDNNTAVEKEKISVSSNFGQKIENVTIVADGAAASKEKALTNALRNSIEKAFGAFISSSTKIENEILLYDEIVSVAKGSIVSYSKIGEIKDPSSNEWTTTISAVVSPSKIIEFSKSKGIEVEFKGSVFAQNILIEKFYKDQEPIIIKNFISGINWKRIYDYKLSIGEPELHSGVSVIERRAKFFEVSNGLHITSKTTRNFSYFNTEDRNNSIEPYDGTYYIPIRLNLEKTLYFDQLIDQYIQLLSKIAISTVPNAKYDRLESPKIKIYESKFGSTYTPENSELYSIRGRNYNIEPTFRNQESAKLIEEFKSKLKNAYEGQIILSSLKTNLGKFEDYLFLPPSYKCGATKSILNGRTTICTEDYITQDGASAYFDGEFHLLSFFPESMKNSSIIILNVGSTDKLQEIKNIKLEL
jgi:hypothetical protein